MKCDFAAELRRAARAALPERAFLRRDRGEALFVTDAPRLRPQPDWQARLEAAGFCCRVEHGLAHLIPDGRWLLELEKRRPEAPDFLCASLRRFAGQPAHAENLILFALGARVLDGDGPSAHTYDRKLRQRAAVCLRGGIPGGGLYACALIQHLIEEESNHEA